MITLWLGLYFLSVIFYTLLYGCAVVNSSRNIKPKWDTVLLICVLAGVSSAAIVWVLIGIRELFF